MDVLTAHALDEAKLVSREPALEVVPVAELVDETLLLAAGHPDVRLVSELEPGLAVMWIASYSAPRSAT
jgi:hypothetical protein